MNTNLFTGISMILLIVLLPVCFANELGLIYDANGNLVTGDGKYREYNSLNQLWKVYNGSDDTGALLTEFIYHPTEERVLVKKDYSNDETTYYISKNFVQIRNSSGVFNFTYVYHEGSLVAQKEQGGATYFVHTDHLGSASVVTDGQGQVVETTSYAPYGKILSGGESSRYGYEGKEHESVLGLIDFNARMYDPDLGIFIQPDSYIQNVYDPQFLNRYSFERNNPYRYQDPDGRDAVEAYLMNEKGALPGVGGILQLGEEINTMQTRIEASKQFSRERQYKIMLEEYKKEHEISGSKLSISAWGSSSIPGEEDDPKLVHADWPTYDELEEWYNNRNNQEDGEFTFSQEPITSYYYEPTKYQNIVHMPVEADLASGISKGSTGGSGRSRSSSGYSNGYYTPLNPPNYTPANGCGVIMSCG